MCGPIDFIYIDGAADLLATSMFLRNLEIHEIRDMVVSACNDVNGFDLSLQVQDEPTIEALHNSNYHIFCIRMVTLTSTGAALWTQSLRASSCKASRCMKDVIGLHMLTMFSFVFCRTMMTLSVV